MFRIPWTRISAPGPVSMNGSPADGSLLVRTSQFGPERLTLVHWGNGHRDAMVFQVKNRQVDLHLRSEGLEWLRQEICVNI